MITAVSGRDGRSGLGEGLVDGADHHSVANILIIVDADDKVPNPGRHQQVGHARMRKQQKDETPVPLQRVTSHGASASGIECDD